MLSVIYAEFHKLAYYAECRYTECRCAECRGAKSYLFYNIGLGFFIQCVNTLSIIDINDI
jgi:hypothetical protein